MKKIKAKTGLYSSRFGRIISDWSIENMNPDILQKKCSNPMQDVGVLPNKIRNKRFNKQLI
jgi:hypothetical protein